MTERRGFASDNHAGVHPEVIEAIAAANEGHAHSYGDDDWTRRAEARFREHFGEQASAFLVFNGTGANVVGLRALLRPYEGVICCSRSRRRTESSRPSSSRRGSSASATSTRSSRA